MNKSIQDVLLMDNAKDAVHLVACCTCFELALFGRRLRKRSPIVHSSGYDLMPVHWLE